MTFEIGLTLGIIVMALVLFATEKLRVDLIALIVLLVAAITGLVSKEEVFSGFANPAVITIWAVYIVSGGMGSSGEQQDCVPDDPFLPPEARSLGRWVRLW